MRRSTTTWINWSGRWAIIAAIVTLGMGCQEPDWDNPAYLKTELKEGNITEQKLAIDRIGDLDRKQKVEVIPDLVKIYNQKGPNQEHAMELLVQLRHKSAQEVYLSEIETNATGYAGAAAEALGETGATGAIPDMIELYNKMDDREAMIAILRGFTYMPKPSMVDPLIDTLKLDVDNNPIALHSYACDILGDIAQENKGEFNEPAVRTLVRAQFLSNNSGQSVQKECSIAIQKLGQKAIPVLVETFNLENGAVDKLMMKYRTDSSKFPRNRAKVGAIKTLVALRADEATDLFIEDLKKERTMPKALPKKFVRPWWTYEAQSLDEMVLGLGDLDAEGAEELLVDTVTGEMNETWSEVMDYRSELQLRQDAAFSLVRIGARDATDALMKMAYEGGIAGLERRAAALEKMAEKKDNTEPMPVKQRYQFNWMVAQAFANLGTGEDIPKLKKLAKTLSGDKMKPVREQIKGFVPMLELAKKCMAKGSAKEKASCYGEALKSDDEFEREKAAWELMRLPTEAAAPVLIEHLDTDNLGTRELLTLGLYRNPQTAAIEKISTILEEEDGESTKPYQQSHYRLKLLQAWLKNNA